MNNDTNSPGSNDKLLLRPDTSITCPACKHQFTLSEGFAKKSLDELTESSKGVMEALITSIKETEASRLAQRAGGEKQLLEEQVKDLKDLVTRQSAQHEESLRQARELEKQSALAREKDLTAKLETLLSKQEETAEKERTLIGRERELEARINEEANTRAKTLVAEEKQRLEGELKEKQELIAEFRATEMALRKEKNDLTEAKAAMALEVQRQIDAARRAIEENARAAESEKSKLREAEMQKTIDDMNAKLQEAQRKGAQGSQQLQGEVLELMLEDQLREAFPLDTIAEVKKGTRGGDLIQHVMTRTGQHAGSILWEAKRTANWGKEWTTKLRDDLRAARVDIGVLVSVVLPKEFAEGQPFGLHEEVWVSCPGAALPLAEALRAELLAVHRQRLISAGKGEKMEAVYDYLTSAQFAQKITAVYSAFRKMRDELESEKTSMQQRWARREKQIQQATQEIVAIAGDIQGLAHQELPQLELEPPALEATTSSGTNADASQ